MARGRMLNRSISTDRRVAQLVADVGFGGGLVFTWLIAWLDKHGRAHGDPLILKGQAFPIVPEVTPELIAVTLASAARLGMIQVYDVNGEPYIAFPSFEKNQGGLRKDREGDSGIPEPPAGAPPPVAPPRSPPPPPPSGPAPEQLRSNSGNTPPEHNLREQNTTTTEGLAAAPPPPDSGVARAPTPDPVPVAWLERAPWSSWIRPPPAEPWQRMSPKQNQRLTALEPLTRAEVEWAKGEVEDAGGAPNFGLLASKIEQDRARPASKRGHLRAAGSAAAAAWSSVLGALKDSRNFRTRCRDPVAVGVVGKLGGAGVLGGLSEFDLARKRSEFVELYDQAVKDAQRSA